MLAQAQSAPSLLPAYITAGSGVLFGGIALVRSIMVNRKKADRSAVMNYRDLVDDLRQEVGRLARKFEECDKLRIAGEQILSEHLKGHE